MWVPMGQKLCNSIVYVRLQPESIILSSNVSFKKLGETAASSGRMPRSEVRFYTRVVIVGAKFEPFSARRDHISRQYRRSKDIV